MADVRIGRFHGGVHAGVINHNQGMYVRSFVCVTNQRYHHHGTERCRLCRRCSPDPNQPTNQRTNQQNDTKNDSRSWLGCTLGAYWCVHCTHTTHVPTITPFRTHTTSECESGAKSVGVLTDRVLLVLVTSSSGATVCTQRWCHHHHLSHQRKRVFRACSKNIPQRLL